VAQRFLQGLQPSLEAQLANLADEIAYNTHDVDDGVRSGLIDASQLDDVALYARLRDEALAEHPRLRAMPPRRLLHEALRRMLSQMIYDLIAASGAAIAARGVDSAEAVRQAGPLVVFGERMRTECTQLKRFLFANLYRHPSVKSTTDRARDVVRDLFAAYRDRPAEMSEEFQAADDRPRSVADYIAGMTDRFALREHQRLTGKALFGG
jgi:dGTPase